MYDVVKTFLNQIELADRAMKAVGIKQIISRFEAVQMEHLASKGLACPKYFLLAAIISIAM